MALAAVKALTFDVFGTVVDWRSSVIAEGRRLGEVKGLTVEWAVFADAWRAGYQPTMHRVRTGALPWAKLDALHRLTLEELLPRFGLQGLSETEIDHLNRVWHRLTPWPDAIAGLTRLRRKYTLATLSNGNVSLLVNMAKNAGLPWDCVLSSELAGHFKPDAEVYRMAADLLSLRPEEILMVAAHNADLLGAQAAGMRTALVTRPDEYGPDGMPDLEPLPGTDVVARDFLDLADQLG